MVNEKYAKAYVEVLECLKLIKKDQYDKIPRKVIEHFEENKDKNYSFHMDSTNGLENCTLMKETNAINLYLYIKYFASNIQKEKIYRYLNENEKKRQETLEEKYNPDNLFKKALEKNTKIENEKSENNMLVIYNNSFFKRILKRIKGFFYNH